MKNFKYFEPRTIEEACHLLSRYKDKAKILAGGTDLLVQMKREAVDLRYLVNIKKIDNLNCILSQDNLLRIGALVTHKELIDSTVVEKDFSILKEACLAVGTVQIRNLGTLIGNICNASPSADTVPTFIALGAKLKIVSTRRERTVLVEDFFAAPFQTILEPDEMVTEVEIPYPTLNKCFVWGGCYSWLPKITTTDETLIGVAIFLEIALERGRLEQVRIALGSVAPTVMRARESEEFLVGNKIDAKVFQEGGQIAANEIAPRSRAEYRRHLAGVLVEKSLNLAAERALRSGQFEETN